ncbi:hypothetical protein [Sphingomonas sanxanigenens]|uniref:Uncharacterized protein n=1 Tax=Sphingomonas sanxanigenens DSM 19645 = NX02 TaxID=1123269 RepID=W0AMD5_9SPHN|nr:hypothetical protein [Sphingomonas sanxanigenens]AHE56875.1 hypothetical protein NX02_26405 [Sphingomonas sanxanigenens DSM 19645 = NX02]
MKFYAALTAIFIPIMAWSPPVRADDAKPGANDAPPAAFQSLIDCRTLQEDSARLACYDKQVFALATARENRDVVIVDREQIRKTRRSLFGLTLPQLDIFGGGKDAEQEEEAFVQIETTIAAASQRDGHWTITLEDGARWRQTDTRAMARDPARGMAIKIRRAAMGSFLANVGNQTAIRVMRIN